MRTSLSTTTLYLGCDSSAPRTAPGGHAMATTARSMTIVQKRLRISDERLPPIIDIIPPEHGHSNVLLRPGCSVLPPDHLLDARAEILQHRRGRVAARRAVARSARPRAGTGLVQTGNRHPVVAPAGTGTHIAG